jgi:hypothetical protein
LKANFNLPDITIGKTSGLIINQVVFEDVTIPTVAHAKKITVNYNLFKVPFYKDIVPAISSIIIEDAVFDVKRQTDRRLNVEQLLLPVTPTSPPPPPFKAKLVFKNCQVNYRDPVGWRAKKQVFAATVKELKGSVSFQHKNEIRINLAGKNDGQIIKITGKNNYANNRYNFTITGEKLDLVKWGNYTVPFEPLIFSNGQVNLKLQLAAPKAKGQPVSFMGSFKFYNAAGRYDNYQATNLNGRLTINDAGLTFSNLTFDFYGYPFSGQAQFDHQQQQLTLNLAARQKTGGKITGQATIDFAKSIPQIQVTTSLNNLDLANLAQNSPGVVGQATGDITLAGPANNLLGTANLKLSQALLLGQPFTQIQANATYRQGTFFLQNLTLRSKNALLQATGNVNQELFVNIQTQAEGIKLAGQGVLGKMEALINSFRGDLSFKLDERFLKSPLKNMRASGQTRISNIKLGDQQVERAEGKVNLNLGQLTVKNISLAQNNSLLHVNGVTGLGVPTSLEVEGTKIELADLKILNYILPSAALNPTGLANLDLMINGELPEITSLDSLLGLQAKGEIRMTGVKIAEIPVLTAKLAFVWQERKLTLSQASLLTLHSNLNLSYYHLANNQITGTLKGLLDLTEFQQLTKIYGRLDGQIGLNLDFNGAASNPQLAAGFWFHNFRFNTLNLDRIEGSAAFVDHKLSTIQPWLIQSDANRFSVTGEVDFTALTKGQPEEIALNLSLKVINSDLASALILGKKIEGEVARKIFSPTNNGKTTIVLGEVTFPSANLFAQNGHYNLYRQEKKTTGFLESWGKYFNYPAAVEAGNPAQDFGGQLSGDLVLSGPVKSLKGGAKLELNRGHYRDFTFEQGKAEAVLLDNQLIVKKLSVEKNGGRLAAQGAIGFAGQVDLAVTGQNFPLDFFKTFFKKPFTGTFNFISSIKGSLANPDFTIQAAGNNVNFAEVGFERFNLSLSKNKSLLKLTDITLFDRGQPSNVSGSLDLAEKGEINLTANLQNNAVGLFNLLTDDVKWRQGNALANLTINGQLDQLKISGSLEVNNSVIYVKAIDGEVKQLTGSAEIKNSDVVIPSLTGVWQGKTSHNYPNQIALAGTVGLQKLLAPDGSVALNFSLSPTWFYLELPNIYSGALRIDSAHLFGRLALDYSSGPTLTAQAKVENALITLARQPGGDRKPLPLNLDLTVDLSKNVYAVLGDVTTLDLSNIFMNLEISSPQFLIGGTLASPSLKGKLLLGRGTVNIFNREFSLLNAEQQKSYFPYQAEKVGDNTAFFSGGEGVEGVLPEISLVAKVDVENDELDSTKQPLKKKVTILSRLQGVIGASDQARGLKISFASFTEDTNKIPLEIVPANYSDQEIKVMLLPDFLKSLTGINHGTNTNQTSTNAVIADYISSRIQTVVFRGLERQLEQKLGLENLRLEYNFGKDVRQAMGVGDRHLVENEQPDWRIGFVKGFFDKLYLEMNFAQLATSVNNMPIRQTFNYQLTYKLSPIWSIMYYREPITPQDLATGYQKITLKAGFSFW